MFVQKATLYDWQRDFLDRLRSIGEACRMDLEALWTAIIEQNAQMLRSLFHQDASIHWHCSNEHFTVEEYIRANCEYPGKWRGNIERVESIGDLTILVGKILSCDTNDSLHVVSFIRVRNNKIISMDEYYGDDGPPPPWRLAKNIGTPIL